MIRRLFPGVFFAGHDDAPEFGQGRGRPWLNTRFTQGMENLSGFLLQAEQDVVEMDQKTEGE